jgi:hypothetical protein
LRLPLVALDNFMRHLAGSDRRTATLIPAISAHGWQVFTLPGGHAVIASEGRNLPADLFAHARRRVPPARPVVGLIGGGFLTLASNYRWGRARLFAHVIRSPAKRIAASIDGRFLAFVRLPADRA